MNLEKDAHSFLKPELKGFSTLEGNFLICIEGDFESAHYLYRYMPDGSDEPIHGHSWKVKIFLSRKDNSIQKNGISLDFLLVRKRLDCLLERIEHLCINDLEEFENINPTAENIARWFFQGLHKVVEKELSKINEIHVYEGPQNVAIYNPIYK